MNVCIDCPCCKYAWSQYISLHTDWGFENFLECLNCGIIYRHKPIHPKEE